MSKKTKLVMVDAVSSFRMRYVIEVPEDTDSPEEYAADLVRNGSPKEFSQSHIGELVASTRVVSKKEAFEICDQDNDYAANYTDNQKVEAFFTTLNLN